MRNRTAKNTNKNVHKRGVVAFSVLLLAFFCIFVGVSYAKYYSAKYRQGIAVASGFYFNSDELLKIPGDVTDIKAVDTDKMVVKVNGEKWSGGNLNFYIDICNYDNNLLFNDANLDVGYTIAFRLLDTPVGAEYYICDMKDETKEYQLLEKDDVVTFENGILPGGSLSSDDYRIRINLLDSEQYNNTKVLVVAYPTSPDYLYKATNQEYRLAGVFQGVYSVATMKVESANFLVEEEEDYTEANWKNKVSDLSGLIYNIKTIGDVVKDADNAVKQEAIVKWKSEYLEISQYDEFYLEAKAKEAETGETYISTQVEGGIEWTYMRIDVLPYTNVDLTFYKRDKFIAEFTDGTMQQDDFETLVDAYTPE